MGFMTELHAWPEARIRDMLGAATSADVAAALDKEARDAHDLAALLSPAAEAYLEPMARQAHHLTRRHFGRTIGLYAPLYLSNVCSANCAYCGYGARAGSASRRTLTLDEVRAECRALAAHGFQHVLLLTGESRTAAPVGYIADAIRAAKEWFAGVSIEVYALDEAEYAVLCDAGLEGVTLYIETYDRETYLRMHPAGKKRDFAYRLDALERAGRAGARRLSAGVLLGLYDWRVDAFRLALQARHLQQVCWRSAIAVSFPRLNHVPDPFRVPCPVSDRELVHLMLALRVFLPEAGFNLSTRETAGLRDRLLPLGITMMSAGSSTRPGGYTVCGTETLPQFEIADQRTPLEVTAAIRAAGYDPVWKDFDGAFGPS